MRYAKDTAVGALDTFGRVIDSLNSAKSDSLIEYTRSTHVEPVVLLDNALRYQAYTGDILQSLCSIFSGYYLQAVAISANVGEVDTIRLLDKLNPNRSISSAAMGTASKAGATMLAMESYSEGLPSLGLESQNKKKATGFGGLAAIRDNVPKFDPAQVRVQSERVSPKDVKDAIDNLSTDVGELRSELKGKGDSKEIADLHDKIQSRNDEITSQLAGMSDRRLSSSERKMMAKLRREQGEIKKNLKRYSGDIAKALRKSGRKEEADTVSDTIDKMDAFRAIHSFVDGANFGRNTLTDAVSDVNLSVGKLLDVTISSNGHKTQIPVSVRLMVKSAPGQSLVSALSVGSRDRSAKGRYHQWRSGEITFWNDLVLCQDIIDRHKKDLMGDKQGIYKDAIRRGNRNRMAAAISLNPSVATASSMVVITTETARQLEQVLRGKLSNFRTREKLFKESMSMILCVVDVEYEQVEIYHRSISDSSELSIKEIKQGNKGAGPDVSEILKAYQLGSAPMSI